MCKYAKIIFFFSIYLLIFLLHCSTPQVLNENTNFLSEISFDPMQTQDLIVRNIQDAEQSIYISLYGFSNEAISEALIEAYNTKNLDIKMVSDFDSEVDPAWQNLLLQGIPIYFGNSSGIMHNKYFLIDDKYLITGSANMTSGLFRHYNNTVLLKAPQMIKEYKEDFDIQITGNFKSKKQEAFKEKYGENQYWEDIYSKRVHKLNENGLTTSVYFTPYRQSFKDYRLNDNYNYNLCANSCIQGYMSNSDCMNNDASCTDTQCYYEDNNYPGIVYRYWDYQKSKYQCPKFDNALNIIIPLLQEATKSIQMLAFAFTESTIVAELIRAQERGVKVEAWMERNQYAASQSHSSLKYVALAKNLHSFKYTRRPNSGLLHHKVIIVDNSTVILGSLNFSQNAVTSNDENFLVFKNAPSLASSFQHEIHAVNQYSYPAPTELETETEDERDIKL